MTKCKEDMLAHPRLEVFSAHQTSCRSLENQTVFLTFEETKAPQCEITCSKMKLRSSLGNPTSLASFTKDWSTPINTLS